MGSFLATSSASSAAAAAAAGIGYGAVGFMIRSGGPSRASYSSTLLSRFRLPNIHGHIAAGPWYPYPASSAIVQFTIAPSSAMSTSRRMYAL